MQLQDLMRIVSRPQFEMFPLLSGLGRQFPRWPEVRASDGTMWRQFSTKEWWLAVTSRSVDVGRQVVHPGRGCADRCACRSRFGSKTERLAWLIHHHVVLSGCATIQLSDREVADCLWGAGGCRPDHWRGEILQRLQTLQTVAAGLAKDGSLPKSENLFLEEALDCRAVPKDDRCWERCPMRGTGAHHHYIVGVTPAFLGSLELCRRPGVESESARYNFHDKRILRRLGKANKITRVFLPAVLGESRENVGLTSPIRQMILGLFRELTRAPRREQAEPGEPLRIEGAVVPDFSGKPAVCPLLDPNARYVVFGGNGYRSGRGYKVNSPTGWRLKLCGMDVSVEQTLEQLGVLAEILSLHIVGASKSGHWLTLGELNCLASRRLHGQLDQVHVRVYAPDHCWIEWARQFGWSSSEAPGMPLFQRVGLECRRREWQQRELARRMGIAPSTLSRFLSGERRMPVEIANAALCLLSEPTGLGAEDSR